MALTRSIFTEYLPQLHRQIGSLLPHRGLPLIDRVRVWTDRMLVIAIVLLCWAEGS